MKPGARRCVGMAMKSLVLIVCVACGGNKPTPTTGPGGSDATPMPRDTRSAIEKRRDTACEQVGAKLTQCAVADAKADLEAGKIDKKTFDLNTAPQIQAKNTEKYVTPCKASQMSSRQVRVLEVCFKEESECDPLLDCLTHINDHPTK